MVALIGTIQQATNAVLVKTLDPEEWPEILGTSQDEKIGGLSEFTPTPVKDPVAEEDGEEE